VQSGPASAVALGQEDQVEIASVLVHDLQFSIETEDPAALLESIDREGILSDSLGVYDVTTRAGELLIGYTGPLLSDPTVQVVQDGIARAADSDATRVLVIPRTGTGSGVDLAAEPAPARAAEVFATGHGHEVTLPAATDTAGESSGPPFWAIAGAVFGAWIVTLAALLWRRKRGTPAVVAEQQPV
jgi:hypothetical protein